jgi:hypothetical protein
MGDLKKELRSAVRIKDEDAKYRLKELMGQEKSLMHK